MAVDMGMQTHKLVKYAIKLKRRSTIKRDPCSYEVEREVRALIFDYLLLACIDL